jgi:hypothetical protein
VPQLPSQCAYASGRQNLEQVNMQTIPTQLADVLRGAGWFPGRAVETVEFQRCLEGAGYAIPEKVHDFLREFGGLRVMYEGQARQEDTILLDAGTEAGLIPVERVADYENRVRASLCPVGVYVCESSTLLMSADGEVYSAFDEFLSLVGRTGIDALSNIVSGVRPTAVT